MRYRCCVAMACCATASAVRCSDASTKALSLDVVARRPRRRACRVLDAEPQVLIVGETGVGKEVFARELHRRCSRYAQSFIAVNCAALPEGLEATSTLILRAATLRSNR